MRSLGQKNKKILNLLLALSFVMVPALSLLTRVDADQLTSRNIFLSSAQAGEANVIHTISFQPITAAPLGSIAIEYCVNSPLPELPCVAPVGLNISGTNITNQVGNTGFSLDAFQTTANSIVLTRAVSLANIIQTSYEFNNITNPSTQNETTYVRIGFYSSIDATGTAFDFGSVAFSTAGDFSVGLFVPPYMTFCVAQTVSIDCTTTNGSIVDFGELSSVTATAGTTQMSVATNDPTGFNIFLSGQTMTSGNNIVLPLTTQGPSVPGTSQFGINLRSNSSPSVGSNPDGVGTGFVDSEYNSVNNFKFLTGDRVAAASLPTEFTRFTVSYIVNVSENQPPGVYASTLTYTAVASF